MRFPHQEGVVGDRTALHRRDLPRTLKSRPSQKNDASSPLSFNFTFAKINAFRTDGVHSLSDILRSVAAIASSPMSSSPNYPSSLDSSPLATSATPPPVPPWSRTSSRSSPGSSYIGFSFHGKLFVSFTMKYVSLLFSFDKLFEPFTIK
ncbi:hypothetical protein RHGRI_032620 [Rhododendron griersonianum]|uniref:Uncharacterized protein n=1 Tax=Rhododendron griersonianum TaxID=479676 RepID=A0AAV6II99_9ERIC|nr:hypothetical protein RHGRI_032620 [Rhododendron griersonianum]